MCKVYRKFLNRDSIVLEHFIYEYASYSDRFIQKHGYSKKGVTRRDIRNKSMVRSRYQYYIYLYYSIQIYAFSFMYSRKCNEALRKCLAWLFSAIIFNNCNWFVFGRKSLEMFQRGNSTEVGNGILNKTSNQSVWM